MKMANVQRQVLVEAKEKLGENISPFDFKDYQVPQELIKPY